LREIDTRRAGTLDIFVMRSGSPADDSRRVTVKVPAVRNGEGTEEFRSNLI
jgi:hypothetical protein